jgi:hypothetical protein
MQSMIMENCERCRQFRAKKYYKCRLCGMRVCHACMDGQKFACRRCNPPNENLGPINYDPLPKEER